MKYRHKPTVISAEMARRPGKLETLDGIKTYEAGDYIATGVMGEPYIVKPMIFFQMFEPVEVRLEELRADWSESNYVITEGERIDIEQFETPGKEWIPEGKYIWQVGEDGKRSYIGATATERDAVCIAASHYNIQRILFCYTVLYRAFLKLVIAHMNHCAPDDHVDVGSITSYCFALLQESWKELDK